MKNIRDLMRLRAANPLERWLLLVSTLVIMTASVLVYGRVDYKNTINVGGTASPWTTPEGANFSPAAILTLTFLAAVIGLSLFGVLREAFRQGHDVRRISQPSTSSPDSENEGWEEAPVKKEDEFSEPKT
jgi:hypothetical protein